MDEDIKKNLIAQHSRVTDLVSLMDACGSLIENNDDEVASLRKRTQALREQYINHGIVPPQPLNVNRISDEIEAPIIKYNLDYNSITAQNIEYLVSRGLLDKEFDSLFSAAELQRIERALCQPICREKWDKWDFVSVFSAAVLGVVTDFLADTNTKFIMDGLSKIDTLKKWSCQTKGLPIDYQGPGFGGKYHRGLSSRLLKNSQQNSFYSAL